MKQPTLGQVTLSFFEDHLKAQKGVRPLTVKSYRDAFRLFLHFVATEARRPISRLTLEDLTFERVLSFLRHLEEHRHNHIRTRNQRLAALRTFFEYLVARMPEMLSVAERVAAIPTKRVPPSETFFLERDQVATLFTQLPGQSLSAARDRTLLLFLYNTGARVQEVAELRVANLDLTTQPRVRLHGKGDKWRTCPLWAETAQQLRTLLAISSRTPSADEPVFTSRAGVALTRFGIYKIVRRHTEHLTTAEHRHVSPHIFRHTTAMHLIEAGVEVNVIRGWLGHVSLETTNRYAEITIRAKEAALSACEPPASAISEGCPLKPVWRSDESLLGWLDSL